MAATAAATQGGTAPMMVCASPDGVDDPVVVLADGSYETDTERVYWRKDSSVEVARIPLQSRVTVRPLRSFPAAAVPRPTEGEARLLAALREQRSTVAPRVTETTPDALRAALVAGDTPGAEAQVRERTQQVGLDVALAELAACLRDAGAHWVSTGDVLTERLILGTAREVLARLRQPTTVRPQGAVLLLASPPGDRHTFALQVLAHQLQEAGHRPVVLDDVPLAELARGVGRLRAAAVVVSAHLPLSVRQGHDLLHAVRAEREDLFVAFGGPGCSRSSRTADLVTSDVGELLTVLDERLRILTRRERDVLQGVADGMTNAEIARHLGISSATVKTHLDRAFVKSGTGHRAAAVATALRRGWIT